MMTISFNVSLKLTWDRDMSDNALYASMVQRISHIIMRIWTGAREARVSLLRQTEMTADFPLTWVISCITRIHAMLSKGGLSSKYWELQAPLEYSSKRYFIIHMFFALKYFITCSLILAKIIFLRILSHTEGTSNLVKCTYSTNKLNSNRISIIL